MFEKYIIKRNTFADPSLNTSVASSSTCNSSNLNDTCISSQGSTSQNNSSTSSDSNLGQNLSFDANSLKLYVIIGCNLAVEYTSKGNVTTAIEVLINTVDILTNILKKLQKRTSPRNILTKADPRSALTTQVPETKTKQKEDKEQLSFMKAILAYNIANLYIRKKKYSSALSYSKIAEKKFSYYGNSEFSSLFQLVMATVYCLMKKYEESQNIIVDCLILIRYMKYHKGKESEGGSGAFNTTWIFMPIIPPDTSAEEALKIVELGDVFRQNWYAIMKVISYHNLALCKAYFQSYGKSLKLSVKSLEIAKQIPDLDDVGVLSSLAKTLKYCKRMSETASAYAGHIFPRPSTEPEQVLQTLQTVTDVKKKIVSLMPFLGKIEEFKELDLQLEEDEEEPSKRVSTTESTRSSNSQSDSDNFLVKSSLKNTLIAARNESSLVSKKRTPTKSTTPNKIILPPVKKRVKTSIDIHPKQTFPDNVNTKKQTSEQRKSISAPKNGVPHRREPKLIESDEAVSELVSITPSQKTEDTKDNKPMETAHTETLQQLLETTKNDTQKMEALLKLQLFFRKKLARNRIRKIRQEKEQALKDFLAEERKWFEENKDQFDLLLEEDV